MVGWMAARFYWMCFAVARLSDFSIKAVQFERSIQLIPNWTVIHTNHTRFQSNLTEVTQLPNALLGKTNKENDKNLFTLLHFLLTSSAEAKITI